MSEDQFNSNTQRIISQIDELIDTSSGYLQTENSVSTQQIMADIDKELTVSSSEQKEGVSEATFCPVTEMESSVTDKTVMTGEENQDISGGEHVLSSWTDQTQDSTKSDSCDNVLHSTGSVSSIQDVSSSVCLPSNEEAVVKSSMDNESKISGDNEESFGSQPFIVSSSESLSVQKVSKDTSVESDSSNIVPPSQGFTASMFIPRSVKHSKEKAKQKREQPMNTKSESKDSERRDESEFKPSSAEPPVKRPRTESEEPECEKDEERYPPLESDMTYVEDILESSSERKTVVLKYERNPQHLSSAKTEFEKTENFLRGCKWSPDGTCILTNSNDNCLRLFNLPDQVYSGNFDLPSELTSVLKMKESELIYDFCWYPMMNSADPSSCCLVSTCRETPIHMWDAFTGELRCSYRGFNQVDEITAAHSLAFSLDGSKLYSGYNKTIRVFDTASPGRDFQSRATYKKQGQSGIISCIAVSPSEHGLYAAGSYSRTIALYHEPKGDMACMFEGQQGGVTHIMFSPDGNKLFTGGRKDPELLCWDLRKPGHLLFVALRHVETNQRIYYDLDSSGRYLFSGNHDGSVSVWDMLEPPQAVAHNSEPLLKPAFTYSAHQDVVNGLSVHPAMPLMCTASGQRHFPSLGDSDDSDVDTPACEDIIDNSLKLWYFQQDTIV